MRPFSLNIKGRLIEFREAAVMGILNVTPDSFYSESRAADRESIREKVSKMVAEGASFIDIGGYSTRPGCRDVSPQEELARIERGMEALRSVAPDIPVSIDTFRAEVAEYAVKNLSVDIINDISGGNIDPQMHETVARLQVPYVIMHMRGTPQNMMANTDYEDILSDVIRELASSINHLNLMGVNDVIIDPGFGFSKTLEQNYMLLKHLDYFEIFHMPILVGISRKSMLTKLLNIDSADALEATTALNMAALQRGASILRVHDVAPAVQAVKIFSKL